MKSPAGVFQALGDEARWEMVERLAAHGELSLKELGAEAGITRQGVRKHLDILEREGLVSVAARGREKLVTLEPAALQAASRRLEAAAAFWEARLDRLKRVLEAGAPSLDPERNP
jgi:predicted ArsR family transcriptional regulator